MKKTLFFSVLFCFIISCKPDNTTKEISDMQKRVNDYAEFKLTSNIDDLSDNQKEMLSIFFEVGKIMDRLFWHQAYKGKQPAMDLSEDDATQKFLLINYGPWDRLNDNTPFLDSIGAKPAGSGFYPADITKDEFESFDAPDKTNLYTIINRNENGELISIPYHEAYKKQLESASELLKKASCLAEDKGFKRYLELRAEALLTSDYLASDMAWMDMKNNRIDFVVGPIETYEDRLFGYKASFEAFILLKDLEWSKKLDRFAGLLPDLQKKLPVEEKYKKEVPGSNSDLGAYDVVFYGGDCNAGSKTIAINLPNDPVVQAEKGSRRLQLKNSMQAKFDKILVPISQVVINPSQLKHITFDAFFENTMFHEVAHGIGVHHVINNDKLTVREALKDKSSALEEGKADILGLFIVDELVNMGELDTDTKNNYVTFSAGLFRSIRFGSSSAHGIANLMRYNYFKEKNAFTRDEDGIYTINFEEMRQAIASLTNEILVIQGNGDYDAAVKFVEKYAFKPDELTHDLDRINTSNIPVDIVFKQGPEILGIKACNPEECSKSKNCNHTHN
jgi:hypothetical protein